MKRNTPQDQQYSDETLPSCDEKLPSCDETLPSCDETLPSCDETLPSCDETLPCSWHDHIARKNELHRLLLRTLHADWYQNVLLQAKIEKLSYLLAGFQVHEIEDEGREKDRDVIAG